MVTLEQELKRALPKAKLIDNTGMKSVISPAMMKRIGVWSFGQSTHHQDLRSAGRIGLYGAVKEDDLNRVIYDFLSAGQVNP
jgi:hypothetical protein